MSTERPDPAAILLALCEGRSPDAATIVPVHTLERVARDSIALHELLPLLASLPDDNWCDADLDALEQARTIAAEVTQ